MTATKERVFMFLGNALATDGTGRREGALAVQMACTHTTAMAVLAKMALGLSSESAAFVSAAARLMRAHATQVEVLRRLRHGNQRSTTEGGASCQRWVWFCRVVGH